MREIFSTFRPTIFHPSSMVAASSVSKPVLSTKMPPSRPMRMFLIRCAMPATASPIMASWCSCLNSVTLVETSITSEI